MRRAGFAALLVLAGCGGLEYGELVERDSRSGEPDGRAVERDGRVDEASSPRLAGNRPRDGRVTVRPGDDLYSIARRHGVSANDLIELNALVAPYDLFPGEVLELPEPRTYEVEAGDTLSMIAERLGVPLALLGRRNGLEPPYPIYVGQILELPGGAEGQTEALQVADRPDPSQNTPDPPPNSVSEHPPAEHAATPPMPAPVRMVPESEAGEPRSMTDGDGTPPGDRPDGKPETREVVRESETPFESEPQAAIDSESAPEAEHGTGTAASPGDDPSGAPGISPGDGPVEEAASPAGGATEKTGMSRTDGPVEEAETPPAGGAVEDGGTSPTGSPIEEARAVERLDSGTGPPPPDPQVPVSVAFQRPVTGRIIAGFGPQPNGLRNDGLNFIAPPGSPVRAAADGTVAYVGNEVPGFGNLVLIRHDGGWVSAYAHNERVLVADGEPVQQGDRIALVGNTGRVTRPQLHFELRRNGEPVDPLPLIGGR